MFTNFATAISTSTAVTLGLLYVMNLLIDVQPHAIVAADDRRPITWSYRKIEDTDLRPIEEPVTKEFVDPPTPPANAPPGEYDPIVVGYTPTAAPPPANEFTGFGPTNNDGPLVSLIRVSPTYPVRAAQAGLEGWVLVQFDVLADGTVANITIVDSSDLIFHDSARDAAARARYRPQIVQGVPQVTRGVQNIFRFQMNK